MKTGGGAGWPRGTFGRERLEGFAPHSGEREDVGTIVARPYKTLRRALPPRRAFAVLLLLFIGFLYYRPLVAYLEAREALARRSAEVASLRQQKRGLEARLRAERTPEALVREARRLTYVKPGERLFIVKGVEGWRRDHARRRAGARLHADGGR